MHQPSALEFEMFDRLLFLTQGGRTVYFGDIGPRASVVLDYFRVGGTCGSRDNPAEFLLDMVNKVAGDDGDDWPAVWDQSQEKQAVVAEIERLSRESLVATETEHKIDADSEFAVSFLTQLQVVTYRIAQQFWRSPLYVWSKLGSCIIASLYIGFSFYDAEPGVSGVQNVSFALVMITVVFTGHAIGVRGFFPRDERRTCTDVEKNRCNRSSWNNELFTRREMGQPSCTHGVSSSYPISWSRFRTRSSAAFSSGRVSTIQSLACKAPNDKDSFSSSLSNCSSTPRRSRTCASPRYQTTK